MKNGFSHDQRPGLEWRVGEPARGAVYGNLDLSFGPEDYFVRITWSR